MVGRRKEEAKAETGVGKGGIGGILMARRSRIEGTDRGKDPITDQQIGRVRGICIEGSGRAATREEGMRIDRLAGHGSEVTLQAHLDEEGIHEIEITTTEDDEE